jgi:iron complex outermembrane recepter protein
MKRKKPVFLLGAWIALTLIPFHAIAAAQGGATSGAANISGRVQNVATGQFLNNARVAVRGTDRIVFTDESGSYRLTGVPAGTVVLDVSYTGLDSSQVSVNVPPGANITQNIELTNVARYGRGSEVVHLDSFVVASSREMEGQALAIHEQRYAPNLKNVVSADAHGDTTAGNVGELIKFLPGVTIIEGGDGNANQVSVRGLNPSLTDVNFDGAQVAHAPNAGNTRNFDFKGVNINDVARVELTKVPTPATPADTLGGNINMISKSAFERSKPEFRYRAYFSANSEDFTFRRTPFPYETKTLKNYPGFDLSYTRPVNENFGFVLNAANNIAFNVQDIETLTWNAGGTATGATPARPFLQSYGFTDAPKYFYRQAGSAKFDWRPTANSVLSFNLAVSRFRDDNANQGWTFTVGTNGTPTPASGIPMTFTPDTVNGATGRGGVTMAGGHHHITQTLFTPSLRYRYDNGAWRVLAGVTNSRARTYNNDPMGRYGHFNNIGRSLNQPARLVFTGIGGDARPGVRAFDNNNQEIDLHDINNYVVNTATSGLIRNTNDTRRSADLGVRRTLPFLPVPAFVEVGGARREQIRDSRRHTINYTYTGPDGDRSAAPFRSRVYQTPSPIGAGLVPWASPRIAFLEWQKNPSLFIITPAQAVANETSRITNSEHIEEDVTAGYVQGQVRLFQSRLTFLTGVRYEKTETEGVGPRIDPAAVWVRNPDGTFARNAAGQRIRRPEAGAVGSIDQLRLTHTERGFRAGRSYDGFYPSAHATYSFTDSLQVRGSFARTYGRPNFTEIIPNTQIDEADVDLATNPTAMPGSINVRNTGLRPWTARNYDLSAEYYTDKGGLLSVGVFRKDIKDFFGSIARVATAADVEAFGLDPRFIGWTVRSKVNAGDARVSGAEFNFRHSLGFIGPWAQQFHGFINGTKLRLEGGEEADWRGFVPEMLNWGVTYSRRPFTVMAQWTHRGKSQESPQAGLGPGSFMYRKARTSVDCNIDIQVRRSLSLFLNARNVFNAYYTDLVYGPETPDYARHRRHNNNGVQFAFGIKGTF